MQDWAELMRVGESCGFVSCRKHKVCIVQRGARAVDKYTMLKRANPGGNKGWLCHCGGVDVSAHPGICWWQGEVEMWKATSAHCVHLPLLGWPNMVFCGGFFLKAKGNLWLLRT